MKTIPLLLLMSILLAACSQAEEAITPPATAVSTETATTSIVAAEATEAPTDTAVPEVEATIEPTATTEVVQPTVTPLLETAVPSPQPIEVTYFTPSQQEGPYYTVNKPADKDNDLVTFAEATDLPNGQILEFDGIVYDATGFPLEGVTIEIWQTDANGVYLHPNDPGTAGRDPNFQFYGEAVTDASGHYSFRTILPGLYEPRPRHIHVKIKLDGQELLTTQFYFADEINLQGDDAAMLVSTEPSQDAQGNPILVGTRDIILNFIPAN